MLDPLQAATFCTLTGRFRPCRHEPSPLPDPAHQAGPTAGVLAWAEADVRLVWREWSLPGSGSNLVRLLRTACVGGLSEFKALVCQEKLSVRIELLAVTSESHDFAVRTAE